VHGKGSRLYDLGSLAKYLFWGSNDQNVCISYYHRSCYAYRLLIGLTALTF
jgi:hypothetical protein